MSDINPLGASTYYGGLQNATSQAAKNAQKEKTASTSKVKFSDILKTGSKTQAERETEAAGFPAEIANMSIEEAAVFLKDAVDTAGNKLAESATTENIMAFRDSVQMFIKYIVNNNYIEHKKTIRGFSNPAQFFSKYNQKKRPKDPRVIIQTINQKLDSMVRDTLTVQASNLKILERANEIKGLIVDLMQA